MLRILTQRTEAEAELHRICDRTHDDRVAEKEATVQEVLTAVKRLGDRAVLDYTREFDGQTFTPEQLRVSDIELDAAYQHVSPELLEAIRVAARQIEAFHRQRVPKSWVNFEENDVVLGKRYNPVDRAGIYVPGGRGAYPSTVLMNAIPAKVAGVPRIAMVTPPGSEKTLNRAVLVAAQEAGIQEIYRVGGRSDRRFGLRYRYDSQGGCNYRTRKYLRHPGEEISLRDGGDRFPGGSLGSVGNC